METITSGFTATVSQRKAALVAGLSIFIMAIAAGFSSGYVHGTLIASEDAGQTFTHIQQAESLFRAGIFGWLIILICDVLASWALYLIFSPVNQQLSLLTAWLRLIYSTILGMAILNLVFVLLLVGEDASLTFLEPNQQQGFVLFFLNGFQHIWSIGLALFGIHLLGLGFLAVRSGFIPQLIGILILIAGLGYLIVHLGILLSPAFLTYKSTIEMIFMLPMIAGELGLGLWLLIKHPR